ncbi:MAG: pyrrolo-quinoline quinone, partial [Alphaproteobacteria bacterium]|nr:pyrrolo-quinoline quinone [Alphaproteobacteria bacterium]
ACDTPGWLGKPEAPPLPGERISILALGPTLTPDPAIADLEVRLPRPRPNAEWPQPGGPPGHAPGHLAFGDAPREAWRSSIGAGSTDEQQILASPVVADGRVFAFDAEARVSAFAAASGERLWRVNVTPEDEEEGTIGGGVAHASGRLFVATGYGELLALEADRGHLLWRVRVGAPLRAPPTVSGGRVFVISLNNELHVFSADSGAALWEHAGITEPAGLLGSASPAVEGEVVVAAYSSGEVFALRVDNGRVAWGDSLASARVSTLSGFSDIRALPVIDRGEVFAISHSGRMVALDLRSGRRIWDQAVGGVQTPVVAGEFLWLVTSTGEAVCLSRADGRIRWVTPLPRWEDEEDRTGPILWSGPLLASDRLIVTSSSGLAVALSPYDGRLLGRVELPDGAIGAPVIADGTLYILMRDADLIALR